MRTAFVIFNGLTVLDFVGAYDPLTRLKTMDILPEFEWDVCAVTPEVTGDRGLGLVPGLVGAPLDDYDLIVVPGGKGTRSLQYDDAFITWLKSAEGVAQKASVCTGSILLGAAGFLKGCRATTHPDVLDGLMPYCGTVVEDERIVVEEGVVTAGGVSAGIDLGLYLVEQYAGQDARRRIAGKMDYPYDAANRR